MCICLVLQSRCRSLSASSSGAFFTSSYSDGYLSVHATAPLPSGAALIRRHPSRPASSSQASLRSSAVAGGAEGSGVVTAEDARVDDDPAISEEMFPLSRSSSVPESGRCLRI